MTHREYLAEHCGIDMETTQKWIDDPKLAFLRAMLEAPLDDLEEYPEDAAPLPGLQRRGSLPRGAIVNGVKRIAKALRPGHRVPTVSPVPPDTIPDNAKIEGLVPTLRLFAAAKQEHPNKLAVIPIASETFAQLADEIENRHNSLERTANGSWDGHMTVVEREAATLLRDHYELVRSTAKADPELWGFFQGVETYLYGPGEGPKEQTHP